ncbi:MAG: hypothetical protein M1821_006911 [Bathelium mastoideum]|nr:MAG: hypothetical protein M1821_006911 [Bathelium mastoideum]
MITRPIANDLVPAPLSQAANKPPYPASPVESLRDKDGEDDDGADSASDWDKDSNDGETSLLGLDSLATTNKSSSEPVQSTHAKTLPDTLRTGSAQTHEAVVSKESHASEPLPEALRVGSRSPSTSPLPSNSTDQPLPQIHSQNTGSSTRKLSINNPYLRKQSTGASVEANGGHAPSQAIPALPSHPPPPPPINVQSPSPPVEQFASTSLLDKDTNPPAPFIDSFPEMRETPIEQLPSLSMSTAQHPHTGFSPIAQSNPWESEITAEQKWSDSSAPIPVSRLQEGQSVQLPENEDQSVPELPPRKASDSVTLSPNPPQSTLVEDIAPPKPPRPNSETAQTDATSHEGAEAAVNRAEQQRNTHYSIKHMNWFDARSKTNPRRSPILLQNANGPCPLLALVNTLVLATPPGVKTALTETLRHREQVSLSLLLNAVLEELMSETRGNTVQELPDVGELYDFLITLHTGMNVNPRFVPHPAGEFIGKVKPAGPGGFEETREMRLYSTFTVPLLHGWLPSTTSPAFAALHRSAPTYEDAQNIQFREEELEDKLQVSALTPEEQQIFEDVISIKEFLQTWPTQLTDFGLQVIQESIKPGQITILFRNDHFSTLYKEPRTKRLMTLVTDAGFAGHDEIIWESLADVSGRHSEFFSGDFRPIGNVHDQAGPANPRGASSPGQERPIHSLLDDDNGWESITPRHDKPQSSISTGVASAQESGVITSPATASAEQSSATSTNEQEDHDLALALQLQEEEEDAHRRSQAARRREDDLSRRYLSHESPTIPISGGQRDFRPDVPPRRGAGAGRPTNININTNTNSNPSTTHRPRVEGDDAPPPPYEQAAADRPYVPGVSNVPTSPGPDRTRRQSAYGQQAAANSLGQGSSPLAPAGQGSSPTSPRRRGGRAQSLLDQMSERPGMGTGGGPPVGRRRASGQQDWAVIEEKEKCVVM